MTRLQADLAIAACAAIWGLAFLFQKSAVEQVGPFTFVAARLLLAAAVLAPFALIEQRRHDRTGGPVEGFNGRVAVAAIALTGGMLFQQTGIAYATVTNTGLLTGLYVVMTPLLAWAVLGRSASGYVWVAAVLSILGAVMLGRGTIGGFGIGDGLVAICALFWAAHLIVLDAPAVQARPITFTALHMGLAGLACLIGALLFETVSASGLVDALPAIAYGGLLSSALTYAVLAWAMRKTTAAEAAVISGLEVVFAAASGVLLLGERLEPLGWAGAALMIGACIIVQAMGARSLRRRNSCASTPHERR